MQVCQRFLKHAIPWFIGVGLRYWTLCNSTHGPSGVLGYWQVTGVSLWFIPLPIRYFNRGITGAGRQKSRLRDTGAFQRGSLLMDKQLLLMAVRLTQCHLMPDIANTMLCWQHFPDLSLLTGWQRCTWVHIFRPTLDSAVQNSPKLSQIFENTSFATVTGSLYFYVYPVPL